MPPPASTPARPTRRRRPRRRPAHDRARPAQRLGRCPAATTRRSCAWPPTSGIAISTDGVGSKIVVAEQADRLETVGIDCVAMNVNDLVCVGAEPIAMLDYLAVEQADPRGAGAHRARAEGRRAGRGRRDPRRRAGGAARAHPRPSRRRTASTCAAPRFGTVALDAIVTGAEAQPGDAIVGLPSSGLHSNGYTLARRALLEEGGLALDDRPALLEGALGRRRAARADRHLRARRARPAALGHPRPRPGPHHRRRPAQPAAPGRRAPGLRHRGSRCPCPPICTLVAAARRRPDEPRCGTSSTWAAASSPSCPRPRGRRGRRAARRAPPGRGAHRHGDRRRRPAVGAGAVAAPRAAPPQKISGHHGATSPRKAADARASAPGRSSATRPAAASSVSSVPPR